MKVFTDLRTRGCQDILITVTDGLKGMSEALAAVFPDAQNAPTGTWKTAQIAVSHSAHTRHRVFTRESRTALHTEILTLSFRVPQFGSSLGPDPSEP